MRSEKGVKLNLFPTSLSPIQNLALLSSHAHHIAALAGKRCPYAAVFRHATLHHNTVGVEYFHKRVMPGTANTKHAVTARHGGGSNGVEVGNGSGRVGKNIIAYLTILNVAAVSG